MKYLHTMVRVTDLDASLDFYCNKLGLELVGRHDYEAGRFTSSPAYDAGSPAGAIVAPAVANQTSFR